MPSSWYPYNEGSDRVPHYKDISLVAHVGKILLEIIARRLSEYCERVETGATEWFPAESFDNRYHVCGSFATGVGAEETTSYICLINLAKACDSVDQTFLWTVLDHFGVPQNMISVIG